MKRTVVLSVLVLTVGCMRYVPAAPQAAPRYDAPVQLRLEQPQVVSFGELSVGNTVQVEGRVVGADADVLRISVAELRLANGVAYPATGEVAAIPRAWIAQLNERRLAVGRSALLSGALIVGAAALHSVFTSATASGRSGGNPRTGQ